MELASGLQKRSGSRERKLHWLIGHLYLLYLQKFTSKKSSKCIFDMIWQPVQAKFRRE